jgi:hypothetical protein
MFAIAVLAYPVLAYLALSYLPMELSPTAYLDHLKNPETIASLLLSSQSSIRSGAVTLLTGSFLGIAGGAAILSFGAGRRDAERNVRNSQDRLFTDALGMLASEEPAIAIGATSMLGTLAKLREDLREPASSALYAVVRTQIRLTGSISWEQNGSDLALLADRNTLAASALRVLGRISCSPDGGRASLVMGRRLDNCDLRGWEMVGGEFDLVTFSRSYFWDARLIDCKFRSCVFSHADWTGASLTRVEFVKCDLSFNNLGLAAGADVVVTDCIGVADAMGSEWLTVTRTG